MEKTVLKWNIYKLNYQLLSIFPSRKVTTYFWVLSVILIRSLIKKQKKFSFANYTFKTSVNRAAKTRHCATGHLTLCFVLQGKRMLRCDKFYNRVGLSPWGHPYSLLGEEKTFEQFGCLSCFQLRCKHTDITIPANTD